MSRDATTDELIRMRCASDSSEVVIAWSGSLFAFVPGERPRALFDLVGMNVARCLHDDHGWHLTSRELMYYVDPATSRAVDRWTNPWTGQVVPVVHVANRRVQMPLAGPVPLQIAGTRATLTLDIPVFYPNPLAEDDALRPYVGDADYQAGEFFALSADSAASVDRSRSTVPELDVDWFRIGPWLPWMNMGPRPGHLVYQAHGHKVAAADLPSLLRDEIAHRLPLYAHAPTCLVAGPNETSWTYFMRHLAQYLAGERFPLPEQANDNECNVVP